MKILALEPFYTGSHKSFLAGWQSESRHNWTIIGLPGYKWKWRMRHAPITFAQDLQQRLAQGESWDALFCSDMLALHEFYGLMPRLADLPSVYYFHENQFTYPEQDESKRDYQYAFTNLLSAHVADEVWFNSEYHREDFLTAAEQFLTRMPDYSPIELPDLIRKKSQVQSPGIVSPGIENSMRTQNFSQPLHILWAARWEFDKNPETFFAALSILQSQQKRFRVSVIGEQFKNSPRIFKQATDQFINEIHHFGFLPTQEAYLHALIEADVFVSSAIHEFFGIGCVEAIAHGCYPLAPKRLAYPETVGLIPEKQPDEFFYDGSTEQLADKLTKLIGKHESKERLFNDSPSRGVTAMQNFHWKTRAKEMDDRIDVVKVAAAGYRS
ncbi:MAG: DUF3524 domain-containing protein [Planctomycetales bacterium]